MSKELDYLDKILNYQPLTLVERTIIECIKEKIQRLESIDNANPSEALEILDDFKNGLVNKEIGMVMFQQYWFFNQIEKVKQALLKQQEKKTYLKWEDLEFSYGTKVCKVRMRDTIYKITYRCCDSIEEVQLLSEDEKLLYISFVGKYKDNVQLFNDLHLERVEE